jgi:hypothetical protein
MKNYYSRGSEKRLPSKQTKTPEPFDSASTRYARSASLRASRLRGIKNKKAGEQALPLLLSRQSGERYGFLPFHIFIDRFHGKIFPPSFYIMMFRRDPVDFIIIIF